jgi:hypothetical protein
MANFSLDDEFQLQSDIMCELSAPRQNKYGGGTSSRIKATAMAHLEETVTLRVISETIGNEVPTCGKCRIRINAIRGSISAF